MNTRSVKRVTRSAAGNSFQPLASTAQSRSKGKSSKKTGKNSTSIAPPTPRATQPSSLTRGTRRRQNSLSDSEQHDEDEPYLPDSINRLESESEHQSPNNNSNSQKQHQPAVRRRQKRARTGKVINSRRENLDDDTNPADEDDLDEEDDFEDDDELLARLERHVGNSPTQLNDTNNPLDHIHSSNTSNIDEPPTLEEYKSVLKDWSITRISKASRAQGPKSNAVPFLILKEAQAVQKLYKQQKELLALMGRVSSFTLNKALGELGRTRIPDALRLWQKYSFKALEVKSKMPRRGQKGVLGEINRKTANIWRGLSAIEKKVFQPSIFYHLSGLPNPTTKSASSDEDSEDEGVFDNLTTEERTKLQAMYDDTVLIAKVAKVYAKVAAGIPNGPSLPDYNRKSLKCVQSIHNQIKNESNHMDFGYYFLVASTHAPMEGGSAEQGWSREFTSHPDMEKYVNEKCNFATIFAAQVQGLLVDQAVANVIGKKMKSNSNGAKKASSADEVKGKLAKILRTDMCQVGSIKPAKGFPRGPDPAAILIKKGYPVRMVQLEGSTLPADVLQLGFRGMNGKRSLWLDDIQAGLFKFEKTGDATNDNQNGNEQLQDEDSDHEDESEWMGLGDDHFGDKEA